MNEGKSLEIWIPYFYVTSLINAIFHVFHCLCFVNYNREADDRYLRFLKFKFVISSLIFFNNEKAFLNLTFIAPCIANILANYWIQYYKKLLKTVRRNHLVIENSTRVLHPSYDWRMYYTQVMIDVSVMSLSILRVQPTRCNVSQNYLFL